MDHIISYVKIDHIIYHIIWYKKVEIVTLLQTLMPEYVDSKNDIETRQDIMCTCRRNRGSIEETNLTLFQILFQLAINMIPK